MAKKENNVPSWVMDIAKAVETEGTALDMRAVTLNSSKNGIEYAVTTGSVSLDLITGGGWAPGRAVSVFGPEQSGKSTDAWETLAWNLLRGTVCFIFDTEQALDADYIDRIIYKVTGNTMDYYLGEIDYEEKKIIKPGLLYYFQPNVGEDVFRMINRVLAVIPDVIHSKKKGWCWARQGKTKKDYTLEPRDIEGAISALVIIDSLAHMVPEAKEDDDTKNPLGAVARMLSQELPKTINRVAKKRCTILYTNQIRNKIGVMFGCLHGETLIHLKDGSTHTIREIVENKIKGEVLSYNEKTGKIEYHKIKKWFYNGNVKDRKDWITITTKGVNTKNSVASVTVTQNHKLLTENGWKEAKYISKSDSIMTPYRKIINGTLREFLVGVFCGDSTLNFDKRTSKSCLRLQNSEQSDYNTWKKDKLLCAFNISYCPENRKGTNVYFTEPSLELSDWKNIIENRNPLNVKKYFSTLSLAILFMDDGHSRVNDGRNTASISFKRFKGNKKVLMNLHQMFKDLGYENSIYVEQGSMVFDADAYDKLSRDICKYVPKCMEYKLPPKYRGKYKEFDLNFEEKFDYVFTPVIDIKEIGVRRFKRDYGKYDLGIESTHNYIAGSSSNGIIVHNSPEDEVGGNAPKFASSQRLRFQAVATSNVEKIFITSGSKDKEDGTDVDMEPSWNNDGYDKYRYAKVKVKKNKLFSPHQSCWVRYRFEAAGHPGDGIDEAFDVYQYLYMTGQCSKKTGKGLSISLLGVSQDKGIPEKLIPFLGDKLVEDKSKKKNKKEKKTKTKEKEIATFDRKLTWVEFKELVENPERKHALRSLCTRQIKSGYAFSLYFEMKNEKNKEEE